MICVEQLIYANVAAKLSGGRGYGVAGCSNGWPESAAVHDDTGGLEALAQYTAGGPRSVVVHKLPLGLVMAIRASNDRDPSGRQSYRVHALLDTTLSLHPLDLIHASRTLSEIDLPGNTRAEYGTFPQLEVPSAEPGQLLVANPLVIEIAAHLVRSRSKDTTCLAVGQTQPDDLLTAIEQALRILPRSLGADTRFATWQERPSPSGNPYRSRLPALDIVGVGNGADISNLTVAATPYGNEPIHDRFHELVVSISTLVRAGFRPDENIAAVEELMGWAADREFLLHEPGRLGAQEALRALSRIDLEDVWEQSPWLDRVLELIDRGGLTMNKAEVDGLTSSNKDRIIRALLSDGRAARTTPRTNALHLLGWSPPAPPTMSPAQEPVQRAIPHLPPPSEIPNSYARAFIAGKLRDAASEWRRDPRSASAEIDNALRHSSMSIYEIQSALSLIAQTDPDTAFAIVLWTSDPAAHGLFESVLGWLPDHSKAAVVARNGNDLLRRLGLDRYVSVDDPRTSEETHAMESVPLSAGRGRIWRNRRTHFEDTT
uniref:hypothetical protein n=1 Tax=Rhodococcus qingshengii TaxID=334542 RepID=UPI001C4E22B7|nr:hypothetical protein [Rhodococcus qingshengii]